VQDVGAADSVLARRLRELMSCTALLCRTNGSDASRRTGRACVWSVSVNVLRMLAKRAVLGVTAGGRRLAGEVLSEAAGVGGEMVLLGDFT